MFKKASGFLFFMLFALLSLLESKLPKITVTKKPKINAINENIGASLFKTKLYSEGVGFECPCTT